MFDFLSFRIKNPTNAAAMLEIRMLIFAIRIYSTSINARFVMKIDIVNPIPPKIPAAKS
jgi:hypothetical protein